MDVIEEKKMRKLTILVVPCIETGHVNACLGELVALQNRGHQVIFVLDEQYKGHATKFGYEEYIYSQSSVVEELELDPETEPEPEADSKHDKVAYPEPPPNSQAAGMWHIKLIGPWSPKEKLQGMIGVLDSNWYMSQIVHTDRAIKAAIDQFKPDCIFVDAHSLFPAVYYSGIPWIKSCSMGPAMEVFFKDVPPGGSGLPQNSDRTAWPVFDQFREPLFVSKIFSKLLTKMGYKPYPGDVKFPNTQILTVYAAPEEVNFPSVRDSSSWFNLESFSVKVHANGKLEDYLPKSFIDDTLGGKWSGKYVYLSMGSIVSVDVELLQRLTSALAKTKNKYIVSKGPLGSTWTLPANMWGGDYLPQTNIIPLVDLVLTHCGNNSFTETYSSGIPMVGLPVFADQYDNAQRLVDTGLGMRVDPYRFTDDELIKAVESVLADQKIRERMAAAGKRIQSSGKHQELAETVEGLLLDGNSK